MDFFEYYKNKRTFTSGFDTPRLNRIIDIVGKYIPERLLDVGCGDGYLLKKLHKNYPNTNLSGVDAYSIKIKGLKIKRTDITKGLPFDSSSYDCVILGEVIEHVPNPDFLLREIRRVLKRKGVLIISTPNLVSWANRILFPFGIQPLYTETSSEVNMGRFFKVLGDGAVSQGHLKVFTYKSLQEILERERFSIEKKIGVPFYFPFPISLIDDMLSNIIQLSSGLIYVARKI